MHSEGVATGIQREWCENICLSDLLNIPISIFLKLTNLNLR